MSSDIVIMAAGKGTRMNSDRPKVLHKLAGKAMLWHVLDAADATHPRQIIIVTGYKADEVRYFSEAYDTIKAPRKYALQAPQLGTGHAVQQAIPFLTGETTVVLNGDVPLIPAATIARMESLCGGSDLVLLTIDMADPTGYGRVIRDETGAIVGIVEQKDATPEQLEIKEVYTGILSAPTRDLVFWLRDLRNNNAQNEYYLTDIVKIAQAEGCKIVSLKAEEPHHVMGVNSPEQLAELEALMQRTPSDEGYSMYNFRGTRAAA